MKNLKTLYLQTDTFPIGLIDKGDVKTGLCMVYLNIDIGIDISLYCDRLRKKSKGKVKN